MTTLELLWGIFFLLLGGLISFVSYEVGKLVGFARMGQAVEMLWNKDLRQVNEMLRDLVGKKLIQKEKLERLKKVS